MKKQIIKLLRVGIGFVLGVVVALKIKNKEKDEVLKMSDKHLSLFLMMNQWVQVKQEGKKISDYLVDEGYKNIAIYGMSYAGERLLYELENSDITVNYGIDIKANEIYSSIDIVLPEDSLKKVDAVVVTSICFMDDIKEKLSHKLSCPIISLEDILYEM